MVQEIALSYNKQIGVTFEFSRLVVNCDSCKKLIFIPILNSPQLGLFYCIFNISKADYIITPQFSTIVHTIFIVDKFNIKKAKFLTFLNNSIRSNDYNTQKEFMNTQDHKAQHCLQCGSTDKTELSQCSCDQSGFMRGSLCFHSIEANDLISDTESNSKYFFTCDQVSQTNIRVNQEITFDTATIIQLIKQANCEIIHLTVQGTIKINGPDNTQNHVFGISSILSKSISDVNISLNVSQQNSGLSGSSLMFKELRASSTIMNIRLSGSIISQSTSSNDYFSLVVNEIKEKTSIMMIGIFGCVIKVQSDNIGFIAAKVSVDQTSMNFIYIAPLVPKNQQFIDIATLSQLQMKNNDFICFGYASQKNVDSLKVGTYYDQFDMAELLPQSKITVEIQGGSNIGGLIGQTIGQNTLKLQRIAVMISIDDSISSQTISGVGSIIGLSTQSVSLQQCYVNNKICTQAVGLGAIGILETQNQGLVLLSLAVQGNLYGTDKVGIIGLLNLMSGSATLQAIVSIFLNTNNIGGFIGAASKAMLTVDCTGEINIIKEIKYQFFGSIDDQVSVSGQLVKDTQNIIGSTVNQCSEYYQDNLQQINVSDIILDEAASQQRKKYYATLCTKNAIVNINISQQLEENSAVQVLQNDECYPQNLNIKGLLNISSNMSNGMFQIAGYVTFPTMSIIYINQSLLIDTTNGKNAQYNVSMLSCSYPSYSTISFIRITGIIKSDAQQNSISIASFLFCFYNSFSMTQEMDNIGIFGAALQISQFFAAGAIGIHYGQYDFKISNFIITQSSQDPFLPRQIIISRYYYANDKCSSYIRYDDDRTGSINVEQFYTLQKDFISSTTISSTGKNSQNIGLLIGYVNRTTSSYQLTLDSVAILGSVLAYSQSGYSSYIGALIGQIHRNLVITNTRVDGTLTSSTNSGVIGLCQNMQLNITAAFKFYIQGDDYLGCFGQLLNVSGDIMLYIDAEIAYDKNYVGGLAGYIKESPQLRCNNLIINTKLTGNGQPAKYIVADQDYGKNWYDGSIVNQC